METLVSLCKRRGFIFQSSEIYGGLQGAWDYGPLGVEMANNIKRAWWRAMVQERDDIVGLDASILMHPEVWRGERPRRDVHGPDGRLPQLPGPLPRGRADVRRLPDCGAARAVHRAAHVQPDAADVPRAGGGRCGDGVPAAGDGAGHLRELRERAELDAPEAAVRHRADRQVVPQRDHAAQLHLPRARAGADGDGVLLLSGGLAARCTRSGSRTGARWYAALRHEDGEPARARARAGGAVALLAGDVGLRVPVPDRLGRAGGRGAPRRLRPDAAREVAAARRSRTSTRSGRSTSCRTSSSRRSASAAACWRS